MHVGLCIWPNITSGNKFVIILDVVFKIWASIYVVSMFKHFSYLFFKRVKLSIGVERTNFFGALDTFHFYVVHVALKKYTVQISKS